MTPLETTIAQAIVRTRIERDVPSAILAAIVEAGFVVVPRSLAERADKARRRRWGTINLCAELAEYAKPGDLDLSTED